jgi:hypothetical protein
MFYLDMGDPETFWLNVTNIGLGVVAFICLVVVVCALVCQFLPRLKKRLASPPAVHDSHAFHVPGLGLTMADGGQRVWKKGKEPRQPGSGSQS